MEMYYTTPIKKHNVAIKHSLSSLSLLVSSRGILTPIIQNKTFILEATMKSSAYQN